MDTVSSTSNYERVVKIAFVLNANINFSFSWLRHQFYVISGLALRTNFKNYRVAFCWPIFPQYMGMRLLPLRDVSARKIWILHTHKTTTTTTKKTKQKNYITSNMDNYDFKIHMHYVKPVDGHGIRQNWECLQIHFELETNQKLMGFYCRSIDFQ